MRNFLITFLLCSTSITMENFQHNLLENQNTWVKNSNPAVTLFYQGMFCSASQCSLYMGKKGLEAPTDEHVFCPNSADIIYKPFLVPELKEVEYQDLKAKPTIYDYCALTYWIKQIIKKNNRRINDVYPIIVESLGLNTFNKTISDYSIDISQMSLGQGNDIENFKNKWLSCKNLHPSNKKIAYGVSRGAAATFNALAQDQEKYKDIKFAVFEGCYDSVENVINYLTPDKAKFFKIDVFFHWLLEKFTSYKRYGISPIKNVPHFPKNIPVLFVTSKKDTFVPMQSAVKLAYELAYSRKPSDAPVYLLTLDNSSHPRYMMDNEEDKNKYLQAVHTLYKKYNLPYIPKYAENAESYIDFLQLKKKLIGK